MLRNITREAVLAQMPCTHSRLEQVFMGTRMDERTQRRREDRLALVIVGLIRRDQIVKDVKTIQVEVQNEPGVKVDKKIAHYGVREGGKVRYFDERKAVEERASIDATVEVSVAIQQLKEQHQDALAV